MERETEREIPDAYREDVARLWSHFYEQLKLAARRERGRLNPYGTLNTTAIVNEAYLRLRSDPVFQSREHFLRTSVVAMRYILIDKVRRQMADKRGGNDQRVALHEAEGEEFVVENDTRVLALHQALRKLAENSPRLAQVAECHYFGGYSHAETAEALGTSVRTVYRDWQMAKSWLANELGLLRKSGENG